MVTLNQTIEILKNFSLKHKSLSKGTYLHTDNPEVGASSDINFPLMVSTLIDTTQNKQGLVTRTFQIDISDLVNLDLSNKDTTLSDIELICFDLINYLDAISDNGDIDITIGNISKMTDYHDEKRDEMSYGYYFTIEISTHIGNMSCNLPIADGSILDDSYIYIGANVTTKPYSVRIVDQDGNLIKEFNTDGQYVVTVLSGIRDTITANQTTITDNII